MRFAGYYGDSSYFTEFACDLMIPQQPMSRS